MRRPIELTDSPSPTETAGGALGGGRRLRRARRLTRRNEPGDGLPDGHHVTDLGADPGKDAFRLRLDLDHGLVGLDLQEHLAFRDALALLLSPGHELPGLLRHFERGHDNADSHMCVYGRRSWLSRA